MWLPNNLGDELATVRISKVVIDNFKSVRHGEITLSCGRKFVPCGTESDILGLYGQNGSGKSALIDALSILKYTMSGRKIPDSYAELISANEEFAHFCFEFDFQYPDERKLKVGYSFDLKAQQKNEDEVDFADRAKGGRPAFRAIIFNEVIKMGGLLNGKNCQYRSCIDTSGGGTAPFGPASKYSEFFVQDKMNLNILTKNAILSEERSRSFIFMPETMRVFHQDGNNESDYYVALAELNWFALAYLHIADTQSTGAIASNFVIPVFTEFGALPIYLFEPTDVTEKEYEEIVNVFDALNVVLQQLIPGLSVEVRNLGKVSLEEGEVGQRIELIAHRNDATFPLRNESNGIKRIISITFLIVLAYNQKSTTVVIDEFDSGIFEYLIGEILQIIEQSGQGQLIFTSHNLRPLEVLNKDFIWFTTTNPDNRYYKMKNIGATNNLREVYFREILLNEQDEELYDSGKRHKIISALRKADPFNALQPE